MSGKQDSGKRGNTTKKSTRQLTTKKQTRQLTSDSIVRLGGKPKPREIKPSEIHELRMKTLQIQNQTKLQKTQLNRLKDKIAAKTEAINKTVSKSSEKPESTTIHQTTIEQVTRSVDGADNTLQKLKAELESCKNDDRTAAYQETEEELKVTFLEYDRLQGDIKDSKKEAKITEDRLKAIDARAGPDHATELKVNIERNKGMNMALREKWEAYQKKILKMKIESRICENRIKPEHNGKRLEDIAQKENQKDLRELQRLTKTLDKKAVHYQKHVEELMEIIDKQRRRIVDHLMGNDIQQQQNQQQNDSAE